MGKGCFNKTSGLHEWDAVCRCEACEDLPPGFTLEELPDDFVCETCCTLKGKRH